MKFNRIYLSVFYFLIIISLEAQSFPDYLERGFLVNPDSLYKLSSTTATPSDGIISPDEYYIGPGDKLLLVISGVVEQTYQLSVDQECNIYIPKAGIIDLKNLSLSKTKERIIKELSLIYKNVSLQISLIDFKTIKVSLIGNVLRGGSYALSGNSRLMDLIIISSGLQNSSDLRNINIISTTNDTSKYDLISFLRLGDKRNNPYLREGDIVVIDRSDKLVSVYGAVKNPGIFEFVENETVKKIIELTGGFQDRAKLDTIEVASFLDDNKTIVSTFYSYDEIMKQNIILKRGDKIIVREKPEYLVDQVVTVRGYVKYPGVYKIVKDQTSLYELVSTEVGGFLKDASIKDAYIIRTVGSEEKDPEYDRLKSIPRADMTDDEYDYLKQKSRHVKGKMIVDFERLFVKKDQSENIILKRGDVIEIPEAKNYITIVGQVINPGNIIFNSEYTIDNYIELAGGFGWRALKGDIRVIKSNTGEWVDEDDVENLEPGDIIWVPEDPPNPRFWDVFQTSLNVIGQVATVVAATVAVIIAVRK